MRKLKKGLAVALAMAMTLSMAVGCGDKRIQPVSLTMQRKRMRLHQTAAQRQQKI